MPVTPSLRLAAAFFALTATALVAKDLQTEPFRANTQLVSVYATVKDKTGRLVPNLTKDDFTVYDNGKPQPLSYFGNDLLPFSIVVMLDRSASMARDYDLVRDAAITFVRQMLPNDRMRIGSFSTKISIHPETFTNDQDALIDLLRTRLEPVGSSPVWTAIDQSLTAVLPEPQRRVVLVFTDGHNDQQRGQVITHLTDVLNIISGHFLSPFTERRAVQKCEQRLQRRQEIVPLAKHQIETLPSKRNKLNASGSGYRARCNSAVGLPFANRLRDIGPGMTDRRVFQ